MIKAAVCTQTGAELVVMPVTLPELGPHQVRVRAEASGICRTDLAMQQGLTGLPMPMVLGHEGAGTVIAVGSAVSRCRPGDRVILSWAPECGVCWHCVRHESQHCDNFWPISAEQHVLDASSRKIALMGGIGTFAEVMQVSEHSVVPVETDLPWTQLAMIGCGVTTGVGAALWTAKIKAGETVVVFGVGGVGLSVIQGCRIAGAMQIIAVDPLAFKRDQSLEFGATAALDPADGDVVERIRSLTRGRGTDHAFEVTGLPDVMLQAFHASRKAGSVTLVGMPHHEATLTLPLPPLFIEERRVAGCFYGSAQVQRHFPMLVEFAERGQLDLGRLVSKVISLDEVNAGIAALDAGERLRTVIAYS